MEYTTGSYIKEERFISVLTLRVKSIVVWKVVLCGDFLLIGTLSPAERRECRNLTGLRNFRKLQDPQVCSLRLNKSDDIGLRRLPSCFSLLDWCSEHSRDATSARHHLCSRHQP